VSSVATGFAPCAKASRYVQQLVSHWSHKMAASWQASEAGGRAEFPFSEVTQAAMETSDQGITITLTTADAADNVRMRGVIERHLDRFAFREAPLSYEWTEQ
jgi:hypothetical protein